MGERMKQRLFGVGALVLTAGIGATVLAAPAHAFIDRDPIMTVPANVWFQSFERSGPDAPCVAPASLDIAWQADWPASENVWRPSWAQWANGGKGGWVCNRQITWSPAQFERFD
jgi:hypothetical protein